VKAQSWDVPIDHGGRPGAANDAELIGARRLQAVASNLGRDWFGVRQMTVIDDLPWARIGTALGLTPKTAKTHSITPPCRCWPGGSGRSRRPGMIQGPAVIDDGGIKAPRRRRDQRRCRAPRACYWSDAGKTVERSDQLLQQCRAIAARDCER
jgi:hypothetical protein